MGNSNSTTKASEPVPVPTPVEDGLSLIPLITWSLTILLGLVGTLILLYLLLWTFAPVPRAPRLKEKQYLSIQADGKLSPLKQLPCWYDNFSALVQMARKRQITTEEAHQITEAELFMTLVIPAYNEQFRLTGMLEEAVTYLQEQYGHHGTRSRSSTDGKLQASGSQGDPRRGWEIILVSDGSTDQTIAVALKFARDYQLGVPTKGGKTTQIPPGTIRVVTLEKNRGKGGAVTHGMRHARGTYVVFADADGASKFSDLGKLVQACERAKDDRGRAVGVGSRAHMVGTEAVVKVRLTAIDRSKTNDDFQRSFLRNTLMHAFHILLRLLTTPKTAQIKDTQCGFKLFTRPTLPYIVPYMHSEGWIFDVEMLMLAESANIPMVEVPIGWKEVGGSKLNVVWDSLGMAYGLALLRVAWGLGIYKR
ncbi:hypothetical protein AMS68_006038 [Peltaster fructicola]|uniref:dolichyl-phosphate beta-glucosyltransferase n=1 Tax=Peltaster fructicola TaxID=286661 RepID=A0A6H0Y0S2_9PEZI|nr:hypothetical protein AMS68_006038 [Peltaster fructicola]